MYELVRMWVKWEYDSVLVSAVSNQLHKIQDPRAIPAGQ